MDLGLSGAQVVITGASAGIGLASAHAFAQAGADLTLVARNAVNLTAAATEIRSRYGVTVHTISMDMASSPAVVEMINQCPEASVLVNNAGAVPAGSIESVDESAWRAAWDVKVFGYINMTRAFYARMKTRRRGVIVNVIGNSGERMQSRYILGSSGNSALMSMTRALGARSPDHGVRVVGVNPGLTATDRAQFMLEGWSRDAYGTPDRWQDFIEKLDLPFGRMGEAKEVADLIAFLASPRASYVSGTIVTVDGGASNRNA